MEENRTCPKESKRGFAAGVSHLVLFYDKKKIKNQGASEQRMFGDGRWG